MYKNIHIFHSAIKRKLVKLPSWQRNTMRQREIKQQQQQLAAAGNSGNSKKEAAAAATSTTTGAATTATKSVTLAATSEINGEKKMFSKGYIINL